MARTDQPPRPPEGYRNPIPPEWLAEDEPSTERFVAGSPRGEARLGLVLKRTYAIGADGTCELAADGEQEVVIDEECVYDELEPPLVSPVMLDNDGFAFRDRTDLVVQGSAHAYDRPVTRTRVVVRLRDWQREIDVHGDRVAAWGPGGRPRFSDPEPFTEMPIRYDRAYGGVDEQSLREGVTTLFHELSKADPDLGLDLGTPYHYARNPAGTGFLIVCDESRIAGLRVPNLEFPFDPLTPDRLAVGDPDSWLRAPLPAAMDWQAMSWFPRIAYLGGAVPEGTRARDVAELERGWVAADLLEIPRVMDRLDRPTRPEYTQAASAGMSFAEFAPDERLELENLHPGQPRFRLRLPGEVPDVRVQLVPGIETTFTPHLNAVVVRPDDGEVVMTWCAHTPVVRKYSGSQVASMKRAIAWKRPRT